MPGFSAFMALFKNQLKLMRAAAISVSVLVALVTGMMIYSASSNLIPASSFFSSYALILPILVGVIATLMCGDMGTRDFYYPAGLIVLAQPVKRWVAFMARFSASAILAIVPLTILFVSAAVGSNYFYGATMPGMPASFAVAVLYMLSFIAFIAFISIVAGEGAALTTGILISVMAVLFLLVLEHFYGIEPWFFLPYAGMSIGAVTSTPYPTHFVPNGIFPYTPYLSEAIEIMVGYTALSLASAIWFYSRREVL